MKIPVFVIAAQYHSTNSERPDSITFHLPGDWPQSTFRIQFPNRDLAEKAVSDEFVGVHPGDTLTITLEGRP